MSDYISHDHEHDGIGSSAHTARLSRKSSKTEMVGFLAVLPQLAALAAMVLVSHESFVTSCINESDSSVTLRALCTRLNGCLSY
jgi:hypothetical protein